MIYLIDKIALSNRLKIYGWSSLPTNCNFLQTKKNCMTHSYPILRCIWNKYEKKKRHGIADDNLNPDRNEKILNDMFRHWDFFLSFSLVIFLLSLQLLQLFNFLLIINVCMDVFFFLHKDPFTKLPLILNDQKCPWIYWYDTHTKFPSMFHTIYAINIRNEKSKSRTGTKCIEPNHISTDRYVNMYNILYCVYSTL